MTRSLSELLSSIELLLKPPFVSLMSCHYAPLSTRLRVTVFVGASGKPKRFAVSKVRGLIDQLKYGDNVGGIVFPMPEPAFRAFLTQAKGRSEYRFGRIWVWSEDGMTLCAFDDMEFWFTRDEARALSETIFDRAL
ncbi:MAG: hypothetical protein ACRC14_19075 [Paracoccaceae bacterium]